MSHLPGLDGLRAIAVPRLLDFVEQPFLRLKRRFKPAQRITDHARPVAAERRA